jgi:hypothetical protein
MRSQLLRGSQEPESLLSSTPPFSCLSNLSHLVPEEAGDHGPALSTWQRAERLQ